MLRELPELLMEAACKGLCSRAEGRLFLAVALPGPSGLCTLRFLAACFADRALLCAYVSTCEVPFLTSLSQLPPVF